MVLFKTVDSKKVEDDVISLVYYKEEKSFAIVDSLTGDCNSYDTEDCARKYFDSITDTKSLYQVFGWDEE